MNADTQKTLHVLGWEPQPIEKRTTICYWLHCSGCQNAPPPGYSETEAREIAEEMEWRRFRKSQFGELWLCPECQEKLWEEEEDADTLGK